MSWQDWDRAERRRAILLAIAAWVTISIATVVLVILGIGLLIAIFS